MKRAERSRQLETLAKERGWEFSPSGNVPTLEEFEFPAGEKRAVEHLENLIEGDNFKFFDVYWKTQFKPSDAFGPMAEKNMIAHNVRQQTIILAESEDLPLAKFSVYPASANSRLINWIDKTFLRNDFSAYPEFAERWATKGAAQEILDKKVIEFYENSQDFWTFANKNCLFIYQPHVLIEPAQVSVWTERIATLVRLFKTDNL